MWQWWCGKGGVGSGGFGSDDVGSCGVSSGDVVILMMVTMV